MAEINGHGILDSHLKDLINHYLSDEVINAYLECILPIKVSFSFMVSSMFDAVNKTTDCISDF